MRPFFSDELGKISVNVDENANLSKVFDQKVTLKSYGVWKIRNLGGVCRDILYLAMPCLLL